MKNPHAFVICLLFTGLNAAAQTPDLMVPLPHTGSVNKAVFSPDGRYVATAGQDGRAKLWEAVSGRQVFTDDRHIDNVEDVVFSPDGRLLVTASADSSLHVWDIFKRSLKYNLKAGAPQVNCRISPDGRYLLAGSKSNTVALWDLRTGLLIRTITVYEFEDWMDGPGKVSSLDFNRDGSQFLTGSFDGYCRLWDTQTGKLLRKFDIDSTGQYIKSAAFSADNKYIVAAEWGGYDALVWETTTGKLVRKFHAEDSFFDFASIGPDNRRVLAAYSKAIAAVYDLQSGSLLFSLPHGDNINDAVFSPDGRWIATVAWNETVKLWDALTGELKREWKGHTDMVVKAAFSADSKFVLSTSQDGTAKVWDISSPVLFRDLANPSYRKKQGTYFTGNNRLATDYSPRATSFDLDRMEIIGESNFYWLSVLYKDESYRIPGVNGGNTIQVYNRHTEPLFQVKGNSFVYPYQVSPKENYLFVSTDNRLRRIYSLPQGKLLHVLEDRDDNNRISDPEFSQDERMVFIGDEQGAIRGWDLQTGLKIFDQQPATERVNSIAISNDNKALVAVAGKELIYYRLPEGLISARYTISDTTVTGVDFNTASTHVIAASADQQVRVFPVLKGQPSFTLDHHPYWSRNSNEIRMEGPIGRYYHTGVYPYDLVWDIHTGLLSGSNLATSMGEEMALSPSRKLLATGKHDIQIWDLEQAKWKSTIKSYETDEIFFSPDDRSLLLSNRDDIQLYDPANGKLVRTFPHKGKTTGHFSPDGKWTLIGTTGLDYLYRKGAEKPALSLLTLKDKDYLALTGQGYYKGSKNASRQIHYITDSLRVISFEQLDVKYNRPDKVLEAAGSTDTALIRSYRRAYEKRIRKLGIDTAAFGSGYSVPRADFLNRASVQYDQKEGSLSLRISGADTSYPLERMNIWVNESPLFGMRGIDLKRKVRKSIDTTIVIPLSAGINRIETSVSNSNGTESYRSPLLVNYTPAKPVEEKLYFIGIGINRFAQPGHDLRWSVKDIRDLARALGEKYAGRIAIDTLFDEQVSVATVTALKQKLSGSTVNDKVILAYSGHGLLSADLDYYLSTYNVNFEKPEENGLPYESLEGLLDGIPARKKLMLIDACHSGEVDKEEAQRLANAAPALAAGSVTAQGAKGTIGSNQAKAKMGLQSSFELMQQLFVNVGRSTGATIISAAAGTQFALEKNDLQNGVFSYSILEYMKAQPHTTLSALKAYVNQRVAELSAGLQVPTTRNETNDADWELW